MTDKRYTHRVLRGFPLDGVTYERGELVSSHGWTWQGTKYVEARGWVEALSPREVNHWASVAGGEGGSDDVSEDVVRILTEAGAETAADAPVERPAAKKAPAKKTATKKPAAKKPASGGAKKAVKK